MIPSSARDDWNELEARLLPFIRRRVPSEDDARDVLQNVLLRVHRGLPALSDDERFGPWVYQVTRRSITDHRRERARQGGGVPRLDDDTPAAISSDDDEASPGLAGYVAELVSRLASPYREALTLTELQGLTHKQAAVALGLSLAAVKSQVLRGRAQLRRALDDCCHISLDRRRRILDCEPRTAGASARGCCIPWTDRDGSTGRGAPGVDSI